MFSVLLSVASAAVSVIGSALQGLGVIQAISMAVQALCKVLGIGQDEQVEDLGNRAIQAEEAGISPEAYDRYSDYLEAIKNFKVNPERTKDIDPETKALKGLELYVVALQEKYPDLQIANLIAHAATNPEYFKDKERLEQLGKVISEDPSKIDDLNQFFNGEVLADDKYFEVRDVLADVEKQAFPNKTTVEIDELIQNLGK